LLHFLFFDPVSLHATEKAFPSKKKAKTTLGQSPKQPAKKANNKSKTKGLHFFIRILCTLQTYPNTQHILQVILSHQKNLQKIYKHSKYTKQSVGSCTHIYTIKLLL
jgi:hypothetical protein